MWKLYSRFYKEILRKEVSTCFLTLNVNKLPKITKISIFCLSPESLKKVIMLLSCFQLFLNYKCYPLNVILAGKSSVTIKVRRKQPVGSNFYFTKDKAVQLLHFAVHFIFPQKDSAFHFFSKMHALNFAFFFKVTPIFTTVLPFFNYFQGLPRVHFMLSCKEKVDFKSGFFFFPFFKNSSNFFWFFRISVEIR